MGLNVELACGRPVHLLVVGSQVSHVLDHFLNPEVALEAVFSLSEESILKISLPRQEDSLATALGSAAEASNPEAEELETLSEGEGYLLVLHGLLEFRVVVDALRVLKLLGSFRQFKLFLGRFYYEQFLEGCHREAVGGYWVD